MSEFESKRRKTSEIWNLFSTVDDKYALCNMCKQKLSYKSIISNLRKHIEMKHLGVNLPLLTSTKKNQMNKKVIHSESTNDCKSTSEESSLMQSISSKSNDLVSSEQSLHIATLFSASTSNHQKTMSGYLNRKITTKGKRFIDEKLMLLFTKDFQPFRIAEDEGFKEFVQALNPSYELPSRQLISKTTLPALYEECVNNTKNLILSTKTVCLTTDCWTSRNTDSFIAITAHFINDNFQLISVLLECSAMSLTHTSQNLASEIKRIVHEWGIQDKIYLTVSDNAHNIKNAICKELEFKHFSCLAHTLHLIVMDTMKVFEVAEIIEKIKIVAHFHRSYASNEKLKSYKKNQGDKPLKLLLDVPTRWNSTYKMLECFIKLEAAIRSIVALIDKDIPILTTDDWKIVNQLCYILKPFDSITKTISGENYCTASLVIPVINGLQNVVKKLTNKDQFKFLQPIVKVAIKLQSGVMTRLGNIENSNTLSVSTFLDPRFKNFAFSHVTTAEHAKRLVINALSHKLVALNDTVPQLNLKENTAIEDEMSIGHTFEQSLAGAKPKGTNMTRAIIEVQRYLDEDIIPRKNNPLKWWKEHEPIFPHLSLLAKEKLCALCTSVPCERLFSTAGLLLSERRNRLSVEKTQMLLFLNSNI